MMTLDGLLLGLIQYLFLQYGIITGIADLFGGALLLIIGVAIIILVVAAAIVVLPAILVAFLIWLVTGSFFYAGIAFLVVAVISIFAMAD